MWLRKTEKTFDNRPATMPSTASAFELFEGLRQEVLRHASLLDSPVHGEKHWRSVAQTGLRIARHVPEACPRLVVAFALCHDARRWDDSWDPEHGQRAAEMVDDIITNRSDLLPLLSAERWALLRDACAGHEKGTITDNLMIGACWDADRFNLWRVGLEPDRAFFSSMKDATIHRAGETTFDLISRQTRESFNNPASWEDIFYVATIERTTRT